MKTAVRISAVVFDLDGTLVDSAPLWPRIDAEFFRSLLGEHGWERWQPIWREMRASGIQNHDDEILERLIIEFKLDEPLQRIKCTREDMLCAAYRSDLCVLPGAHASIRRLVAAGIPLGIASGMSERVIIAVAEQMGWRDSVSAVASTHEVKKNKPHPAVYLLAATRLGQDPASCLAVENEVKGYRSARAAGMPCAFVPDSSLRAEEARREIDPEDIFTSLDAVMSRFFIR